MISGATDGATEEWRPVAGFEGLYEISNFEGPRHATTWTHGHVDMHCWRSHRPGEHGRMAGPAIRCPAISNPCLCYFASRMAAVAASALNVASASMTSRSLPRSSPISALVVDMHCVGMEPLVDVDHNAGTGSRCRDRQCAMLCRYRRCATFYSETKRLLNQPSTGADPQKHSARETDDRVTTVKEDTPRRSPAHFQAASHDACTV